ncbi:UNKNOWN [Stylonychia lemnae]|uniref:Sfi1 spindle body domain-containing protein n=1 Tax=Stylonychia lemnae TaxID=5949 RepID=A0A078ASG7_STYLE|nr:UNKNOWN [Stylonychia lemnae]|eukprot:CDW84162.1 UNKNOWN [Stylonychia lemnae]
MLQRNKSFQLLKQRQLIILEGQKQSQKSLALGSFSRIITRVQHTYMSLAMLNIKKQSLFKRNQQMLYDQTLENFSDLMSDILRQRFYDAFSTLKQNQILKSHQRQLLIRTLLKMRGKAFKHYFLQWKKYCINLKEEIAQTEKLQSLRSKHLRQIIWKQQLRSKSLQFNKWSKIVKQVFAKEKVQLTIRAMAAATKILDLFSHYSMVRQSIVKWKNLCQSQDQQQLGFQLLSNLFLKKMKLNFRSIKSQIKRRKKVNKSNKVKAILLSHVLEKIQRNKYHAVMQAFLGNQLTKQNEVLRTKISQKKNEIHNQIVLLTEKDSKIRKQEAYLNMKEQKILEQEKETIPKVSVDISTNQSKRNDQMPLQRDKNRVSNPAYQSLGQLQGLNYGKENAQKSVSLSSQAVTTNTDRTQYQIQQQQQQNLIQQQQRTAANGQIDQVQLKLYRVALTQLSERFNHIRVEQNLAFSFRKIKEFSIRDRQREGGQILYDFVTRKQLSEALIKWLRSVYQEEIFLQQSIEVNREKKLLRAILIAEGSMKKDEVMLMKAFQEWKRIEYQMVLEGLKKYSATLEKNALSNIPQKQNYQGFMTKISEKRYYK